MPTKKKLHTVYHKDGTPWAKGHLVNDKMDGYWEWYRKSGTIMRSGHFVQNQQVGEWITYDVHGKVYKVTNMDKKKAQKKTLDKKGIKRARVPMPPFILKAVMKAKLLKAYKARPPYQQNDYVGWITQAVGIATKQKRLEQMLIELKKGNMYMKMAYRAKPSASKKI